MDLLGSVGPRGGKALRLLLVANGAFKRSIGLGACGGAEDETAATDEAANATQTGQQQAEPVAQIDELATQPEIIGTTQAGYTVDVDLTRTV